MLRSYQERAGPCPPGPIRYCNGAIPNLVVTGEFDNDLDGYVECEPWVGLDPAVVGGDDCNDTDVLWNPSVIDVCDGLDTNCNGIADDESDFDGDGYCDGDCDDTDPTIHPGLWTDVNGDAVDEDCDGHDWYGLDGDFGRDLPGAWYGRGMATTVAFLGDLDGDGISEFVRSQPSYNESNNTSFGLYGTGRVDVFLGRNSGDPTAPYPFLFGRMTSTGGGQQSFGEPTLPVPDVDGDGKMELLVGGYYSWGGQSWAGLFTSTTMLYGTPSASINLYAADEFFSLPTVNASITPIGGFHADGDDLADLGFVVTSYNSSPPISPRLRIVAGSSLANQQSFNLETDWDWEILGASFFAAGSVGDIDGDGGDEVFVADASVRIYWSGTFDAATPSRSLESADVHVTSAFWYNNNYTNYALAVRSAEIDGDGIPDLVTYFGPAVRIWLGSTLVAGGAFDDEDGLPPVFFPGSYSPAPRQLGDLDGDGLAEIVKGNAGDSTSGCRSITYFYNYEALYCALGGAVHVVTGYGGPGPSSTLTLVGLPGMEVGTGTAAGQDVTGDGIGDLLIGYGGSPLISPYPLNDGGMRVEVGRLPD